METSRIGRPDFDDDTIRQGRVSRSWSSCDPEGFMAESFHEGEVDECDALNNKTSTDLKKRSPDPIFSGVGDFPDDSGELSLSRNNEFVGVAPANCDLFVPDLVFTLDKEDDGRPEKRMPDLPLESFPIGVPVWVVDVSCVRMQLGDAWEHHLRLVCNGQAMGTVVRHSTPDLFLVRFEKEGVVETHTLPRRCLSTTFIAPYELPCGDGAEKTASFGVGLKPRAGRGKARGGAADDTRVQHQFCELIGADEPSRRTEEAWGLFRKRRFKECVAELSVLLRAATSEGAADAVLSEILACRSCAYLYNGDTALALADALHAIERDAASARGYVQAARAYMGVGKISRAVEMMSHAELLLPNSAAAKDTLAMLCYVRRGQARVEAYGLQYCLDTCYAKRLMTRRAVTSGETILEDDALVVGAPSLENVGECCEVCLSATSRTVEIGRGAGSSSGLAMPSSHRGKSVRLCGSRCEAVGRNFISVEGGIGLKGCDYAVQLLVTKASNSADVLSLDRARLAMRLFYLAFYRHKRQQLAGGSLSVGEVLASVGVFPFPSFPLDERTKDDIESLYSVVTSFMSPEDKVTYTKELLINAYSYVSCYAVRIEGADSEGRPVLGYLVSSVASCVDRADVNVSASADTLLGHASSTSVRHSANCEVRLVGLGRVALVARAPIPTGARLVIEGLKKGRY